MSYLTSTLDLCLPVTIQLEKESFEADPGWIAGAFFLGLFVGGGIAALIAPICFRDWEKKKVRYHYFPKSELLKISSNLFEIQTNKFYHREML